MLINNSKSLEDDSELRPFVFLLFDGWGISPTNSSNVFSLAKIPFISSLLEEYPVASLEFAKADLNSRYLSIGSGQEIKEDNFLPQFTLSSLLSLNNLKQIKITETERCAALCYFFNGQKQEKNKDEEWRVISSDQGEGIEKYYSSFKKTVQELLKTIEKEKKFNFIVSSFPLLDLLSKTKDFSALKKGVELIDKNLRLIWSSVIANNGVLIISSSGGGAEEIIDPKSDLLSIGSENNLVPFIVLGQEFKGKTIGLADPINSDLSSLVRAGTLADLTPTILRIMGLNQSEEMTGRDLFDNR